MRIGVHLALISLVFGLRYQAFGANLAVNWIHHLETTANPLVHGVHAYPQIIILPHIEIPLKLLNANLAENWNEKVSSSLIFEKKGEKYVRWILAPTENEIGIFGKAVSQFNQEIIDFANSHGVDTTIHYRFRGYPSASATYLVEDTENKTTFYIKNSNGRAPIGAWTVKIREAWEANDARLISDYLTGLNKVDAFKYFTFFQESAGFTIDGLNRSLIVRDSGDMKNETAKFYYLPAFSITDKDIGREIALKNGFQNPEEFWSEYAPTILARASTEMFLRTGLKLDSPHGQNYLFELDANFKLTGRLVFRDLADVFIQKDFYNLFKERFNLKNLTQKKNILDTNDITLIMTPLSTAGGGYASTLDNHPWLPNQTQIIKKWQQTFSEEVDKMIIKIANVDPAAFKSEDEKKYPDFKYRTKIIDGMTFNFSIGEQNLGWSKYINNLKNKYSYSVQSCHHIFSN